MEASPLGQDQSIFPDPSNPLEIKIPSFEGPLDLLLHLIRKKELDIYKVQLSELTNSYLTYLNYMDSINLDYAGEFLETAATLIWLKSKKLLPKPPVEDELEEEDPEERLRRQLIEYQKYKQAAFLLSSCDVLGRDVFIHPEIADLFEKPEQEEVFAEVSLFGLMEAFQKVISRPRKIVHVVEVDQYTTEDRIEELIQMFTLKDQHDFEAFFEPDTQTKTLMVLTFMAILEMVKLKILCIAQEDKESTIQCRISDSFHERVAKWYEYQEPVSALNIA